MSNLARIRDYDYKPEKWEKFLAKGHGAKSGTPMVGLEVEMVFGDDDDLACFLAEMKRAQDASPAFEKAVFLKRDGSLPDDRSVEVVFVPHHLARLRETVKKVVSIANESGVLSSHHSAGMHIHVTRPGMTLGAQGAFLLFWNFLEDSDLRKVARRLDGEYNKKQTEALTQPYVALLDSSGHYYRVDARRHETLEIRVFSGVVDSDFILSRANLVQMAYGYCKAFPLNRKNAPNWRELYKFSTVMEWAKTHPEYQDAVKACC